MPGDFVAVHLGKPDIEQDYVGAKETGHFNTGRAIMSRLNLVTQRLQKNAHDLSCVDIVVNDQDSESVFSRHRFADALRRYPRQLEQAQSLPERITIHSTSTLSKVVDYFRFKTGEWSLRNGWEL